MRLVSGALALVLFAPIVRAEDTPTAEPARSVRATEDPARGKIPLRVVRVMPESHQALLFDRARATHVLAEVGGQLDGYTVEDIDDDAVTLSRDGRQIVLVAPPRGYRRRDPDATQDRDAVHVRSAPVHPSDTAEPTPVDPYDDAVRSAQVPGAAHAPAAPPEAGEPGIRVIHAPDVIAPRPLVPGEGGIRVAEAPGAAPVPAAAAPALASPSPSASPGPVPAAAGAALEPAHGPEAEAATAGASGIRVVSAPSGPASDAPPAPVPTRGAETPARTPSTAVAGAPAPAVPPPAAAPPAAGPVLHPALAASPSEPPSGDAGRGAGPGSPRAAGAAKAPDKRTLDARALADVMTSDGKARNPRPLAADPPAAAATHPVTAAPAPDARPGDAAVISRGELDRALADFAGLTAALRGSFSASGVTVESVGEGSIFQRAGLRAGDVITSVDGTRLHSLDDAANLYARASAAKAMTAQILRGGKPVTLRVMIR